LDIVVAAAIPAKLYFISIVAMVHFRAGKKRMPRLSAEELPKVRMVLKEGWQLLLAIVVLVAFLALGYSAVKAVSGPFSSWSDFPGSAKRSTG
jgi:TRAP-type uncharacterized transport system fused permease subunit